MMRKILAGILAGMFILLDSSAVSAMSLNVQGAEISELLRSVARLGGLNLILDQSVTGQVSLKMDAGEPAEIIANVVRARGLSLTKQGNTWIVGGEKNLLSGFASVHVMPVKYAPLEDVKNAAALYFVQDSNQAASGAVKSPKASVHQEQGAFLDKSADGGDKEKAGIQYRRVLTDVSTGSLLVYATEEEAAAVRELVRKLDVPARQISIEAKVVSVSRDDASKLGIQWEWSTLPQYCFNGADDMRPVFSGSGTAGGIVSFGKGPGGKSYEWQYAAALEALVTNGKADVLSRPNIITLQGQEAVINIGGEVPVPTVSTTNSTVTTSIEYRPAGIILSCLPMVNEDGYITSRIHTEVSSPQYIEEMNAYSFQKRSADTMVRLRDGETMIIGGLISSEEIHSMSKIPFLGDLPVLGNLFKSVHKAKKNSELFIILKAEIIP